MPYYGTNTSVVTAEIAAAVAVLDTKPSVYLGTIAALPAVTATTQTLTANANGALTVDGVVVPLNARILVKNQVATANNGLYYQSQVGTGSVPFILTRTDDANTWAELPGAVVSIESTAGSSIGGTQWQCTVAAGGTLGTTAVTWIQTGNVTASAAITDNAVVRGDGGSKGTQESLGIISDAGALTGITQINLGGGTAGALSVTPLMTLTGTVTGVQHGYSDERTIAAASGGSSALDIIQQLQGGAGAINWHHVGIQWRPKVLSGTVDLLVGFYGFPEVTGGTVTDAAHIYIQSPTVTGAGVINFIKGLVIGKQQVTGVTVGHAISQEYFTDKNRFAGPSAFGAALGSPVANTQLNIIPNPNYAALKITSYGLGALGTANVNGSDTLSGAIGSSDEPAISVAGSWNTTGTPSLVKLRVTDTASNAASLLIDAGLTSTLFSVNKAGVIVAAGYNGPVGATTPAAGSFTTLAASGAVTISGQTAGALGTARHLTADTAGNAFTISGGGATIGATNKAGGSVTVQSGLGTGTGAVSSLIFQTPTVAGAGTGDQALATRLTLSSASALFTGDIFSGASMRAASGSPIYWSSRAVLSSPSDGKVKVGMANLTTGVTLDASTDGTLKVRNFADGADGNLSAAAGTFSGAMIYTPDASAPALDAGAAISVTTTSTGLAINGTNALTLANGTTGQIKTIVCTAVTAAGTATLTPATPNGYATVAFTAVGQTVTLQYFSTNGWVILSVRGAVVT